MTGDPVREGLNAALRGAYVVERELGGGGMSRVFVAREEALGREVRRRRGVPHLRRRSHRPPWCRVDVVELHIEERDKSLGNCSLKR